MLYVLMHISMNDVCSFSVFTKPGASLILTLIDKYNPVQSSTTSDHGIPCGHLSVLNPGI